MMANVIMWWLRTKILIYLIHSVIGVQPEIVIVGAGAAGIAAASKLYEQGFQNITILEAENRIGGRIHTTWFDESWMDVGGQWVHGEKGNIVFEYAWPLGLLEIPEEERIPLNVYDSQGTQIPSSIANNFFEIFYGVQEKAPEDMKASTGSVGDYFTKMITIEATKYPAANETFLKQFMNLFERFINSIDASDDWYRSSAKGYTEYWECPGSQGVNWKDRGYGTILDILMKRYPDPKNELPVLNNTIMNTEVVNIDYNTTDGKVLVKSSNGKEYSADHVIVTTSLGVLKEQYETLFTPRLPESKVETIKGLAMGAVGKIFFSFEEAWWPDNFKSFVLLWNESDRREYENDPDRKWLLDILGFFRIAHRPRILLCWINGPGSRYMEILPKDQVFNRTFGVLNKFVGQSYEIPRPSGMLRSNWYRNKHFRGTYSFRSVESERADVWAYQLAAPLMINEKPIVLFAGEATNSHHYSTIHGAIETGFREAKRLIAIYNESKWA